MIGRFVEVTADLARVEVRHEGRLVAAHERVWARGMTIIDPAHVATAKILPSMPPASRSGSVDVSSGARWRDLLRSTTSFCEVTVERLIRSPDALAEDRRPENERR